MRIFRAQALPAKMGGGARWREDEVEALWLAVSVHGRNWSAIALGPHALPGRGLTAMHKKWEHMCGLKDIPVPLSPNSPAAPPLVCTSSVAQLVLPLPLDCVLQAPRSVYSGRPWDYVVNRVGAESKAGHVRLPTERQAKLVHCWRLGTPVAEGFYSAT